MTPESLLAGVGIGLAGGLSSGLLGVSPGGALVVFSVLLLGAEQHVAQGVSLVAQIPPTGLTGVRHYRLHGMRSHKGWIALLLAGSLVGSVFGALAASCVEPGALRWAYVSYLLALDGLLIVRQKRGASTSSNPEIEPNPHWTSLLAVGVIAGLSSGFLGIGGGLATTVGLTVALRVPQHQAQMISVALSLIPTTALSAWVYWREGRMASWLIAVIFGLQFGMDIGARIAIRLSSQTLKGTMIILVASLTAYMTCMALRR